MQSDSASRNGSFSTGLFSTGFFGSFCLSSVESTFFVVVIFLEAVGVGEYCCMALKNRLAALCFARSSRATPGSRATNLRPRGLVALGLAESR